MTSFLRHVDISSCLHVEHIIALTVRYAFADRCEEFFSNVYWKEKERRCVAVPNTTDREREALCCRAEYHG